MDLGIAGKTALVCASSKGLGRGCADALARCSLEWVTGERQHLVDALGQDRLVLVVTHTPGQVARCRSHSRRAGQYLVEVLHLAAEFLEVDLGGGQVSEGVVQTNDQHTLKGEQREREQCTGAEDANGEQASRARSYAGVLCGKGRAGVGGARHGCRRAQHGIGPRWVLDASESDRADGRPG